MLKPVGEALKYFLAPGQDSCSICVTNRLVILGDDPLNRLNS